jgi:hypothetical protein
VRFEYRICAANSSRPSTSRRQRVASSVCVADDTNALGVRFVGWKIRVAELTSTRHVFGAHPVSSIRGGSLVGMNNNTIALTNTDRERVGEERGDRHHVSRDDLKHMVVDREVEVEVRSAVYNVNEICTVVIESLLEVCTAVFVATSAVNNDGVCRRRESRQRFRESFVGIQVIPVGNNDGSPFFVPFRRAGSMDEEGSRDTICVLRAVVGVVPSRAILSEAELVGENVIFRDWALCDTFRYIREDVLEQDNDARLTVNSIHLIFLKHAKTMPVDGCAIVFVQVFHLDLDSVTPTGFNKWSRVRPVDELCKLGETIWGNIFLGDLKVVLEYVSLQLSTCTKLCSRRPGLLTLLVIPIS